MFNSKIKTKDIDESQLSHTRYNFLYFIPKYRRKAVYGKLRRDIGVIIRRLCEYKEVEIIEAFACIYVGKNTTQIKCITIYGIFKRKKFANDF